MLLQTVPRHSSWAGRLSSKLLLAIKYDKLVCYITVWFQLADAATISLALALMVPWHLEDLPFSNVRTVLDEHDSRA